MVSPETEGVAMQEQMQNNLCTLSGRIVSEPRYSHSVYDEGFYETAIEVRRLSDATDVIPVTVSERLVYDVRLEEGDYVTVEGQFRSYNKLVDNRSKLMLSLFVRDVFEYDETRNANVIELTGYICKDPVYRTTPFNREICDMLVAVNRAYNKSDYIPCIAWGRNARFSKNLSVGDKITASGRIQSRAYQKLLPDGTVEERVAYEISLNRISKEEDY